MDRPRIKSGAVSGLETVLSHFPHAANGIAASDLSDIAARATRLDERLGLRYQPGNADALDTGALVAERREQWARALSRESEPKPHDVLAKRLAWDGLEMHAATAVMCPVVWTGLDRSPTWTDFLGEVMTVASGDNAFTPLEKIFSPTRESVAGTPFSGLWQPFLVVARRRLCALAGNILHWVTSEAAVSLAADLMRQLATLGAPAGYERFAGFRARHSIGFPPAATDEVSSEIYEAFVASTLCDGLRDFFAEYSALARQLCLYAERWLVNVARLLARLETDHAAIQAAFLPDQPLGVVRGVRPGLSDRHHGGQQVVALEFQSGLQLIYKPKSIDQEAAFQDLLRWLSAKADREAWDDAPMLPPAISVLRREGYGWVQCVEPSACVDVAGVNRYYHRAGGLVCLLHALGGNDCHRDNIFATSEGPILVDIESLLQPAWNPGAPEAGTAVKSPASVLQTGLLPLWKRGSDGEFADVGGLSGQGNRRTRLRRRVWRGINTDGMGLAEEPVFTITTRNLPTLNGREQMPQDHAGALLAGFDRCYRFLLRHRDAMAAADGPLQSLGQINSRLICRPSNLYGKLLNAVTTDARYSRDGFERSVAMEALARPLLMSPTKPGLWSLLASERLAMEEGDVPFFTVAQVAGALGIEPRRFAPDFTICLGRLSEADRSQQAEIIRASLLRSVEANLSQPLARAAAAMPAGLKPLTDAQCIAEARRLATEIVARAEINDQGASWLSPDALRPGVDGARGAPLYFYGGAPGVALFLAALDSITGDTSHRALIEAACRPIRVFLDSPAFPLWVGREPLGAANGLGSVVYTLARIGEFLGDSSYLETASRVARWILPERILADTHYDVLSGAAGAALGLLTLHRVTGETFALDLAASCGRHLCASARPAAGHGQAGAAWPTGRGGALLAGFAHGVAGIGYALSRLHAATGGADPMFLETGRAAAAYERTLFSEQTGNWPVVAGPDDPPRPPQFLSTWCHGAPGIALGRVGGLTALDDVPVRRDIALGLKHLVSSGLTLIDHLCCGNMGRAEIAWTAANALERPELGAIARAAASYVVGQAAHTDGIYRLRADETENGFFEAGFFRGVSGIGYGLLRFAQPKLPCALLFA